MRSKLSTLDPIIHQPTRTQLVAYLASRREATFMELKRLLGLTDGNLEAHLKKLIEAGYLTIRKEGNKVGRTHTVYELTESGRKALAEYVLQMANLLEAGTLENVPFHGKHSIV